MTIVATHNGSFHTDDVFAVATLKMYLQMQGESDIEIIRTRDKEIINKADYVLDVGGVYDPDSGRFDHHQEEGAGKRENGIPYASFGLVWREYGAEICDGEETASLIDERLVQAIDAPDNGIALTGESKFDNAFPYFLGNAVNVFKPTWREDEAVADDRFVWLVGMAKQLLQREIKVAQDRLEGAQLVEEAYQEATDKRIIWLDKNLPYRFTLLQHPEPLFVVYPKDNGRWRLRAIIGDNFQARAKLPKAWRGKRGKALQEATGVDSAIFCHSSLPMITARKKADIDKLTQMALEA